MQPAADNVVHPRNSLRRRLVVRIGVPLLATFLVMSVVQFRIDRDFLVESLRQEMRADVQIECLRLESSFLAIEHAVDLQASILQAGSPQFLPLGDPATGVKIDTLLWTILKSNEFAFGAAFAFDPGTAGLSAMGFAPYVCRDRDTAGFRSVDLAPDAKYNYSKADWFIDAGEAPRGTWSEPYFDEGGGDESMTTYSMRFPATNGLPAGVATTDVALRKISQSLQVYTKNSSYDFALVSAGGKFISSTNSAAWMKSAGDFEAGSFDRELLDGVAQFRKSREEFTRIGSSSQWTFSGTRLVFAEVPSSDWVLVGSFSERSLVPGIVHALLLGPGLSLLAAVIAIGVLWRSADRAVAPLKGVVAAIGRLSKGDLSARAPSGGRLDEIGMLSRSFNRMGDELQGAIAQREEAEAKRLAVEAQIEAARDIQRLLLPRGDSELESQDERATSEFEGTSIVAFSVPSNEIAGDFFDWFARPDGTFALVIADVCGHGLPAAMMMAVCRTLVRRAAIEEGDPSSALARVNEDLIAQAPQTKFTTGILLYVDPRSGKIRYANAGHPPAILVRRDGSTSQVMESTGTVLGLEPAVQWTTQELHLSSGDDLVLISDGVTEAAPLGERSGGLFGPERAEAAVAAACSGRRRDAQVIVEGLLGAVREWSKNNQDDDLTIMTLSRT